MPNTKSAKKAMRVNQKKTAVNSNRRNRIRSFIRKVEDSIKLGDKAGADAAFKLAQPEIHRGVTKGVLHKRCCARRLSKLSGKIKELSTSTGAVA